MAAQQLYIRKSDGSKFNFVPFVDPNDVQINDSTVYAKIVSHDESLSNHTTKLIDLQNQINADTKNLSDNYYNKTNADNTFVKRTVTINKKPLTTNITLNADDIGAIDKKNAYVLPFATTEKLGGIKVGYGLSINPGNGVLSSTVENTLESVLDQLIAEYK